MNFTFENLAHEGDQKLWTAVDGYIGEMFVGRDEALEAALAASKAAGMPAIHVAPNQGKLLHILARTIGARRILEIGTLGGYSAIWMGRAIVENGGGQLITLEAEERHAEVARENLARALLGKVVEVRVGKALELLPQMAVAGPFDMIFIDADKEHNVEYFAWAVRLSRRGSLIVVDNVVRKGAVVDAASTDAGVRGTRRLFEAMAAEKRVSVTAIQTVGSKGYDGLAVAVVIA